MVPAPPRGAPPTLNEPSGRPPPLLQVTPPSPPFLAALSFGMSLREWRHAGFLFLLLGATRASGSPVTDTRGTLDDYFAMKNIVETSNACELPGVSIKYGPFLECMWRAVEKGFVDQSKASFVAEGLKSGFMAGVDVTQLRGHRWFKNYPPALEARRAVTKANNKRVGAFKTLALGVWSASLGSLVRATFGATAIAPLNAVPKPMEKGEVRPCTDHTRTGFNAATCLEFLGHSLDTYNEVAHFLKSDYFMHVSDVDAAFPMLPFHWSLWPFLMFRFFASDDTDVMTLYMHVCGDFGTRGMPGVFKIFFSDVVVNMARAENVLTLPMPIYVDDMGLIGHSASVVLAEMAMFQAWATMVCGVIFKVIKDRQAAQRQLMIGFWWCSSSLTRTLPEAKLLQYVEMLSVMAGAKKFSLHDMQVCAGRMQRAIMTLPAGAACLLYGLYSLMSGLKLGWHARRSNKGVRDDLSWLRKLLTINLGRGYYSLANFLWAPDFWSDASKSARYVGGGYLSACGRFDWFVYGRGASRKPIDFLEGDTFMVGFRRMGRHWRMMMVRCWIDNMSFKDCLRKGRSRVERLNVLVKESFALCLEHQCILAPEYVPTLVNKGADFLSRQEVQVGDPVAQLSVIAEEMLFWAPGTVPIVGPYAGGTRTLEEQRGVLAAEPVMKALSKAASVRQPLSAGAEVFHPSSLFLGKEQTGRVEGDGAGRGLFIGLCFSLLTSVCAVQRSAPLSSTVTYARASLYNGLDADTTEWVMRAMDNRLSVSSWNTIKSGVKRWRRCARDHGFSVVIATDDLERGAKIAYWLKDMVVENVLVWKSISNYLWGMRQWQQLQGQADPAFGVVGLDLLLESVKVLTFTIGEPHRQAPADLIGMILDDTDESSFEDVQFNVLLLVLSYTFSRTECPCPKTYDGFDGSKHWRVRDFDAWTICGIVCLLVRFQAIKQDSRVERPAGRGDGDWSVIGGIPGSNWCIMKWIMILNRMHGVRQNKDGPMFLNKDRQRPYTYGNFAREYDSRQRRVGVEESDITHPHGIRVWAYNKVRDLLGRGIAAAHGGWAQPEDKPALSTGNTRYDRFPLSLVVRIAPCIAGTDLGDFVFGDVSEELGSSRIPTGEIRERAAAKPTRMSRAGVSVSHLAIQALGDESGDEVGDESSEAASDDEPQARQGLPPDWSATIRTSNNGRKYKVFKGPQGTRQMYSLPAAWAEHDRLVGAESDEESAPSLEQESAAGSSGEPETVVASGVAIDEVDASVVVPELEFFEITLGGCGTQGCTFKHGHEGLCSSVAVVPRRRRVEQHLQEVAARSSPSRLGESL